MVNYKWGAFLLALLTICISIYGARLGRRVVVPNSSPTQIIQEKEYVPQFVLLSFDGSRSLNMWKETRDFARKMKSEKKLVNFTYFVSGVYFLPYKDRMNYRPPKLAAGSSLIGFGDSDEEVKKRVDEVNQAKAEGHEIGSHLGGHFKGSEWSEKDWLQEMNEFRRLVPSQVSGLRTPLLSRNDFLFSAEAKIGLRYDSSEVGKLGEWPVQNKYGVWEIPLATIGFGQGQSISMDYNFFIRQTGAKDVAKKGSKQWANLYQETYSALLGYFDKNYSGNRAPVVIGNHFSTWNDGVYWEAMKSMAAEVCGRPEVRCATFSELVEYLDKNYSKMPSRLAS